jgi:DNA-binding NarL/FixJ family response regulator
MSAVRVGVLSDTRLFSEGLARIINSEASLQFVDVRDKDALLATVPAGRPEILLLDGRMGGALALCQRFCSAVEPKILVLALPDDGPLATDALIAGARGILYQRARAKEVVQAITLVHQGKIWAPRHIVAAAWKKCRPDAEAGQRIAGWQHLSVREREVLRHAAAGFANKELADRLAISEATVKVHLMHIFRKVGCRSRTELAAAYHGMNPLDVERPARRRLRA